jgi:hypothetical protein
MNNLAIIAGGLCGLVLTVWAVLRHRREEVSRYHLSWEGWCIRIGFVAAGCIVLYFARGDVWVAFPGIAMIVLPMLFRQIPYEIATRLFSVKDDSSASKR